MLLVLLILIGPFLAAAPGTLVAVFDAPEFFGRRPRTRAVMRRWQVA